MTDRLTELWKTYPLPATAAGVVVAAVAVWGVVALVRLAVRALGAALERRGRDSAPSGAPLFYLVAAMSTGVSVNTSWRFFERALHITNVAERVVMFAVLEAAFVACAYAMRANVRQPGGQPGSPRTVAWTLTLLSAYMAIAESDFWEGLARVALGPVLGIVALHLALGVEIRRASPDRSSPWAQLAREMRERVLSRFGLANDDRDAATRTRHRAAVRAARLAAAKRCPFRTHRLARAVRVSGVAHDPDIRARMLAELAALKSLDALSRLTLPSPWGPAGADAGDVLPPPTTESVPTHEAHRTADPASTTPRTSTCPTAQAVQPVVHPSNGHPPLNAHAAAERPLGGSAVQSAERPPAQVRPSTEHRPPSNPASPQRDRARAAARHHASRHGQLPTVSQLMAIADVARGTAGTALKDLRDQPTALQVVPNDHERAEP